MAELNDEAIVSVLQEKENFDSLLDKSSSSTSSFDTLLEKSPLKSGNLRNNLTLDDGSSSDDEAVKSVRKRIQRFSDSDSDVDKENIQNRLTPDKVSKPNIDSESEEVISRKSCLIGEKDSSGEDISSPKSDGVKKNDGKNLKKKGHKTNKLKSLKKVSTANSSSDSEDDTFPRKSRLVYDDSSDDQNGSRKNKSTSPKNAKNPNKSSESENELPRKSRLVFNDNDSSDDNSNDSARKNNKTKAISLERTCKSSGSEDMPRKSRLVTNTDSSDDNSNDTARENNKTKAKTTVKTKPSSGSEDDIPRKSRLVTNTDSSNDDSNAAKKNNKTKAKLTEKTKPRSGSEDDIPRKSRLVTNTGSSEDESNDSAKKNYKTKATLAENTKPSSGSEDEIPKKSRLVTNTDSSIDDSNDSAKKNNKTKAKLTEKTKPRSGSEDDIPRKSRLVTNTGSSEDESNDSAKKNYKTKATLAEKTNPKSGSEDDIPRKSRLLNNTDSSDDDSNAAKKNNKTKAKLTEKTKPSSDSEDDIPQKSKLVTNTDSSADDSNDSAKKNNKTKAKYKDEIPKKSRLVTNTDSSDDDTTSKNESARISNKRSKLHNKFQGLLKSRSKVPDSRQESPPKSAEENGSNSDDSSSGIESIKQKIKQKSMLLKSGICDPDTSSDEDSKQTPKQKKKKPTQKSTIMISPQQKPKPARMSAKQAMENMQKIKSESNRMLREKEVSLPYHRPKALLLKDIMNRRRPALSADGKALPLKMNSEQLKQYVKLLEQRNKEMMELCKSESEEEEDINDTPIDDNKEADPQTSNQDEKEISGENILPQKDDKPEENTVPSLNDTEDTNENDLPDLTIEIVQKDPDMSDTDVAKMDLSNTDVADKDLANADNNLASTDVIEKDLSNTDIPDKVSSDSDLADKDLSNTDIPNKDLSNTDIADKEPSNAGITEKDPDVEMKDASEESVLHSKPNSKLAAEIESQLMELRYETEKMQNTEDINKAQDLGNSAANGAENANSSNNDNDNFPDDFDDDFDDVDINMEDLESIIENAKGDTSAVDSPMLIRDINLNKKPKLMGAPGSVIDLDGGNPVGSRKLTGVELLKERFLYFAKLKTPEEKERERELTIKPGMQHFKLKHELEEQITEQRSLEWAKRLEEVKQQQEEMNAVRGGDSDEDDLEKIEAKLKEKDDVIKESSSESEEEEEVEENDCDMKDKPRKKNPMIDDEAEVSDDEEAGGHDGEQGNKVGGNVEETEYADNEDNDESEESSDESSEDEDENQSKPKKGRILKAFEDSDDESTNINEQPAIADPRSEVNDPPINSQVVKDSQDDVIPLAQTNQSLSEDLFGSQTSGNPSNTNDDTKKVADEDLADVTTQTFSILNSNTLEENTLENVLSLPSKIDVICETQPIDDANLDDVVGMCSGKFTQTQNVIPAESQLIESQCPIGEDILALCTGKFYDNQFVSQASEKDELPKKKDTNTEKHEEKDLLDSILKEMDDPVEDPNRKKIIFDNAIDNEAVSFDAVNHMKKKFTIDSDDDNLDDSKPAKKKKLKKRKLEKRALQISDDEDEEELLQSDEGEDYMSEVEEENGEERIVEYDSEENEVEVKPQKQKKNRKMAEFFENEAELTSEDEWVGSGDEDERGLDRMEREAGDDDTFHQGQLQRELGQIHMRDVLDQDKREVRLIQELLFEDGDLGDGGRQRKFRWKNLDGEDEPSAVPELFAESQEEEFESEEQWRKQRHEREVFLRNLKEKEADNNISIDRSTIIKANLCSRTMSSLLMEANGTKVEEVTVEKKVRVEPARNLPLTVFQQNYHGSLLTRGRGALARLAALAMPLAGEADEQPKAATSSKRNFVFATVTPPAKEAKAPKRKADNANTGTPRLIKKFKTDEQKLPKASLLDHLTAL